MKEEKNEIKSNKSEEEQAHQLLWSLSGGL
jgi:hypothetical protein